MTCTNFSTESTLHKILILQTGDQRARRSETDLRSKEEGSTGSDEESRDQKKKKKKHTCRVVAAVLLSLLLVGIIAAAIVLAVLCEYNY